MAMKYEKQILAENEINYDGLVITTIILDGGEYYDIHVIHPYYKDDRLNTLELQEPKECVTLEQVTSPIFMECQAVEKALWHKFYGTNGESHNFSISVESDKLD